MTVIPPIPTSAQPNITQNNRSKTSPSTIRPSSAGSTNPSSSLSNTTPTPSQSVRRYVPAHMKAPFQTQPEKKRRPSSTTRNSTQMSINQRPNSARRSVSQQRRPSITPSSTQTPPVPHIPLVQNEPVPISDNENTNGINHASAIVTTEVPIAVSNEIDEMEMSSIPQPIILNRALVKPLRRLWKHNQNLRLRLIREVEKKTISTPPFIDRLNEQVNRMLILCCHMIVSFLRFIHQLRLMKYVYLMLKYYFI